MSNRYQTSRACAWNEPRPYTDPSLRLRTHGRVQPMEQPLSLRRQLAIIVGLALAVWIPILALIWWLV